MPSATPSAASVTAKAPADGYTLMLLTTTNTISPAMYDTLSYRPATDFTLIGSVARGPMLIGVPKTSPIRSLADLVAAAKKEPLEPYASTPAETQRIYLGELKRWGEVIRMEHLRVED